MRGAAIIFQVVLRLLLLGSVLHDSTGHRTMGLRISATNMSREGRQHTAFLAPF
jgi:hypothetical protein